MLNWAVSSHSHSKEGRERHYVQFGMDRSEGRNLSLLRHSRKCTWLVDRLVQRPCGSGLDCTVAPHLLSTPVP